MKVREVMRIIHWAGDISVFKLQGNVPGRDKKSLYGFPVLRGYHLLPAFLWRTFTWGFKKKEKKYKLLKVIGDFIGKAIAYILFVKGKPIRMWGIEIIPCRMNYYEIKQNIRFDLDISKKQLMALDYQVPVGLIRRVSNKKKVLAYIYPSKRYVTAFIANMYMLNGESYAESNSK